jgi:CysZ protein
MRGNVFSGVNGLLAGFGLLLKPGIRIFVLIPLTINVVIFSVLIYFAYSQFNSWTVAVLNYLPDWLDFIDWLLWTIFYAMISLVVVFTFSILANLVAAPFNGFLAEAVYVYLTGEKPSQAARPIWAEIIYSVGREITKMIYYLPRLILLFILSFIPVVNFAMPFIWLLFGAWMMAIQYFDYPMDNNRVSFDAMLIKLKDKRLTPLGFGLVTLGATLIPVLNLIVMPAAVAGATKICVDQYRLDVSGSMPSKLT